MKEIQLTQNKVTQVSDARYSELNKFKWHAVNYNGYWYAARYDETGKRLLMHREITKAPSGSEVDHIDGNGLNNLDPNLRIGTKNTNQQNRRKQRTPSSSEFKGVTQQGKRWKAQLRKDGKLYYLGYYSTEEDAAIAYDIAAKEHFGEYANTNF